jgi:hypothetical protein
MHKTDADDIILEKRLKYWRNPDVFIPFNEK